MPAPPAPLAIRVVALGVAVLALWLMVTPPTAAVGGGAVDGFGGEVAEVRCPAPASFADPEPACTGPVGARSTQAVTAFVLAVVLQVAGMAWARLRVWVDAPRRPDDGKRHQPVDWNI